LLLAARNASIDQLDADDDTSSAMRLGVPFQLRLDWWKDTRSGGNRLKVWAGSMRPVRIARAMQAALAEAALLDEALFDYSAVVFDPAEVSKKVEPYYFDSRRGSNATSRDIGFAPDALQMTTMAFPAVEFFCLVGLQRCQPMALSQQARIFEYHTWEMPCRPAILPTAVCGLLTRQAGSRFRFQNAFRTDQKKHKAFLPADLIGDSR
jgi:CRISPR-associated protein Csb3